MSEIPFRNPGWAGNVGEYDLTEEQVRGTDFVGIRPLEGGHPAASATYPFMLEEEEPEAPDLPAEQADLLLQARLSAAGASPPIRFQSSGDRITVESVPTLDLIAAFLATNPTVSIQIIGHTDSDGDAAANLELSAIRAEAVRTQLVARGIESERLATLGLGETDPIADNLTKGGKNANRRIEFLLIPVGGEGLAPPTTTTFAPVAEEPAPTTVPAG